MSASKYLLALATATLLFPDIDAMQPQEHGAQVQEREYYPVRYVVTNGSGDEVFDLRHEHNGRFTAGDGSPRQTVNIRGVTLDARMTQDEIVNSLRTVFGADFLVTKTPVNSLPLDEVDDDKINTLPGNYGGRPTAEGNIPPAKRSRNS